MMRIGFLACLIFLTACGDDPVENRTPTDPFAQRKPKALPPPVAPGKLRVQSADLDSEPVLFDGDRWKENRWAFDWLESEGWGFFGWKIKAGSAGRASIRWHDPRSSDRDFGTVSLELIAGQPVMLAYGVRYKNMALGPLRLKCPKCSREIELSGAIPGESMDCAKCGEEVVFDSEWANATSREYRVLVFGAAERVRGSGDMRRRGPLMRFGGGPHVTMLVGDVPRTSMMDPTANFADPLGVIWRSGAIYGAGTHSISRRFHISPDGGSSHSQNSNNGRLNFNLSYGDIAFTGTEKSYRVTVAGKPIDIADYPNPVWDFELSWAPGE